ncbi:hypothetical protein ABTM76_20380, partial [Acinetobacter baumannii]
DPELAHELVHTTLPSPLPHSLLRDWLTSTTARQNADHPGGEYSQCYAPVKARSDERAKFIALNSQSTYAKLQIKLGFILF